MPSGDTRVTRQFHASKGLAAAVLVALAAYACGGSDGPGDTAATTPATTQAPSTGSQTTSTSDAPATGAASPDTTAPPAGFTYKVAIFSNPTTDNPWAYFDTEPDVWNQYTLAGTLPSLYGSAFPTFTIVPGLAADVEPPRAPPTATAG